MLQTLNNTPSETRTRVERGRVASSRTCQQAFTASRAKNHKKASVFSFYRNPVTSLFFTTVGNPKVLSGIVTYNGAPGAGLQVRFKRGKNTNIANATGAYSLNTSLMGDQKIVVEKLDEDGEVEKFWEFDVTLSESGDKTENFTMND